MTGRVTLGSSSRTKTLARVPGCSIGVSLTTWILFIYLGVFWIIYCIDVHSWQLVFGGLVAVPFEVLLLVDLRPWSRPEVVVRRLILVALCCLAPGWVWGWSGP
jgi:hypothetical protein